MKKIFLGLMACAALCACTSDDLVSSVTSQKVFEGDVAYMTVSIKDVGAGTRATSPTGNDAFVNGEEAEYAVSDAYFYFYDDEGVFVSEAEVWDGGTPTTPLDNVEFESETVIVLKGLTGKSYPSHVVTILNKPSSFTPGETLEEMQTKLANATNVLYKDEQGNFVMSTSSYYDESSASGGDDGSTKSYYFTTLLTDDDFYEEPFTEWSSPESDGKPTPVDIYVERLAAKITVGVGSEMTASGVKYSVGEGDDAVEYPTYVIHETIAGDPNEEDVTEETGGGGGVVRDGMGTEDIYVAFLGWTTNAVARNSYMMKNIDTSWQSNSSSGSGTNLGFDWNDTNNHRSYWGMSWNYGDDTVEYPQSADGNTDADENGTGSGDNEPLNKYLLYKSLQTTTSLNSSDKLYCEYVGENTNTAEILESKYSSGITSVLIKAVACDAEGKALDLVRYNGDLFTEKAYLQYVMNELTATGKLNVYTKTTVGTNDVYTHIGSTYVTLSDKYTKDGSEVTLTDGLVAVVVDENAFSTGTFYKKTDEGTYEQITTPSDPDLATTVTTALDGFNATANANAYKGGLMYYSIPIEHLNNTYPEATSGSPSINEANYGVVRNHCYSLTITSLSNMGKGIYDENEVIVPDPEEAPTYYVGANINILSWKLVEQSVDL